MATGMEMMLKAFGVDANELKKVGEQAQVLINDVRQRLDRIETNQRLTLEALARIEGGYNGNGHGRQLSLDTSNERAAGHGDGRSGGGNSIG